MREFEHLPDEALLRLQDLIRPAGPLPWRRSKFLEMVASGEAPQPALKTPRMTCWRWGTIREWLDRLADAGMPRDAG